MVIKDKVRIISKSHGCDLHDSSIYNRGNGIGYIKRIDKDRHHSSGKYSHVYVVTNEHPDRWKDVGSGGDFFLEKDIKPFDEFEFTEQLDNLFDDLMDTLQ